MDHDLDTIWIPTRRYEMLCGISSAADRSQEKRASTCRLNDFHPATWEIIQIRNASDLKYLDFYPGIGEIRPMCEVCKLERATPIYTVARRLHRFHKWRSTRKEGGPLCPSVSAEIPPVG